MTLSRLSSIALSALLAIGHSLCVCPGMQFAQPRTEATAHACCPAPAESESDAGESSHSGKPCPHCSTALKGTIESPLAVAIAPVERPLVPVALVAVTNSVLSASYPASIVVRAYAHPPDAFAPLSPERAHVSLLI